jgi:FkbM family methyltransferase
MNRTFIKIGNILYNNAPAVYNIVYPIFKKLQDKNEISLLKKYIKTNDTVLDIGANIGFYSKILGDLTGPGGTVYAFEPDSENFRRLRKYCSNSKNVVLVPKAVSDKNDRIKMYKSPLMNIDHRSFEVEGYTSVEEIESTSIDSFLPSGTTVNFIKMDIQGFEYYALKGMESTIRNNPGLKLLIEFWPYAIKQSGVSVETFIQLLKNYGLDIQIINDEKPEPFDEKMLPFYNEQGFDFYRNMLLIKH